MKTPADKIHMATALPLLREKGIEWFCHEHGIDQQLWKYLRYCLYAYDPEKRDYNLLREFLCENALRHWSTIALMIERLLKDRVNLSAIRTVYDIGAGHDSYARILSAVFPQAKVVLIDKFPINSRFGMITGDVFTLLPQMRGGDDVLFWLSEFIHCKVNNKTILRDPVVRRSHVVVNELSGNRYLQARLEQTGGCLVAPSELRKYMNATYYPDIQYTATFHYFMQYLRCFT